MNKLPSNYIEMKQSHKGPIYCIKFNKDGKYCMSGSQDRCVKLWNPLKQTLIKTYMCHNYQVSSLDISDDNSNFITGGSDKIVFLWDVTQGKCKRKFSGHMNRINSVAYNNNQSVIVSGSYDCSIRFWDTKSNSISPLNILKGFKDSNMRFMQVLLVRINQLDGKIRIYDIRMGLASLDQFSQPIYRFAVSSDKTMIAISCSNSKIYLIQKNSGNILKTYKGHVCNNFTIDVQFNQDQSHLLMGSQDTYLYIYDILNSDYVKKIKAHNKVLSSMQIKNGLLITGDHNGKIIVWK